MLTQLDLLTMKTILVIEDERPIRENITEILELSDYAVLPVDNGAEGILSALKHSPDLVLCDVMMPEMDGYTVLELLKESPETDDIPFVFLTARAERNDLRRGMELGADDYLTKPFTPEELLKAIDSRLVKQTTHKRHEQAKVEALTLNLARSLPHELNTPLNGIIGSASFLAECGEGITTNEIKSIATDIRDSGQRLYRLTQNFLLYAHLELQLAQATRANTANELSETCVTTEVIQAMVAQQGEQSQRAHDICLDLEPITIAMHGSDFGKIVSELLDNALKFSAAGTPITLRSYRQAHIWSLEVSDRGRGFTPRQIQQVGAGIQFDRYVYEQQGMGLGLAIVQCLVQLNHGTFEITQLKNPTTITLTFPC